MHTLHPVAARLKFEPAIHAITRCAAVHAHHHFFVTPQFALGFAHDLGEPALALGIAHVHAQQVGGKQGRFIATRARPNFDKRGASVVGVFGQQHALQLGFEL